MVKPGGRAWALGGGVVKLRVVGGGEFGDKRHGGGKTDSGNNKKRKRETKTL